ncbi:MAG: ATP-binding cassette domain-containing protein, partial [Rhodospirillales bacterium]|nr:ATP-binding cassette domain-containing protein [Rhodospirillales bacterium]
VPRSIGPPSSRAGWAPLIGLAAAALAPVLLPAYPLAVLTEALIAIVFAASLHLMMGPGGMPSFGHAAWFGLGAYGAGLAVKLLAAPVPLALLAGVGLAGAAALLLGLCVVRLSGVYLAMLTLAFAQLVWAAATQWRDVTGGDDGLLGLWPALPVRFYWVVLALAAAIVWLLRRAQYAPFGMALRAVRDAPLRAAASGLPNDGLRFPTYLAIGHSVDALLMVLLGGVQSVSGPVLGALVYTGLYDALLQATPYWRAVLGVVVLVVVLAFPYGLAGTRRSSRLAAVGVAEPAAPAGVTLPAAAAGGATLAVEGLRKSYGGIDALAGVSFALRPGEIVALIGPNGAGKSTCFAVLNGQQRADAGRVLLDGIAVGGLAPARLLRRGVGRTF